MPNKTSGNYTRFRFSIRAKLLVAFVGLALGPMVLLAGWMFWQAEGVLRNQLQTELQVEVATAANAIEAQLDGIGREVLSLERFLSRRLRSFMKEEQWKTVEEEFLQTVQRGRFYFQVRYIGKDGMENIRVNNDQGTLSLVPPENLQYKGLRYYFQDAMTTEVGAVYISHLDFNMEHGRIEEPKRLVVRLGTPVRGPFDRKRGVVILNVFGAELLAPLQRLETGRGGRVLLVSDENRYIEMMQKDGGAHFHAGDPQELAELLAESTDILRAERPIQVSSDHHWRLIKLLPQSELRAALWQGQKNILWLLLPLTLLAALLAILAARTFSRPIRSLSGMAATLAKGDFEQRVRIPSSDELGQLGQALNEMALALDASHQRLERWNQDLQLEVDRQVQALQLSQQEAETSRKALAGLEKQLLQADRMASLGMLAATIAHEVGNPLAGLKLRLQMLQRKLSPEQLETVELGRLLEMVDRLAEFVTRLTGYAGGAQPKQTGPVDLNAVLQDLDYILREEAQRRDVQLIMDLPEAPITVCAQGQHLHQIFMNLMLNAVQATPDGGEVQLGVSTLSDTIEVQIRDTGPGLSDEAMKRAFDPLFTTKEKGTGLGLSIVRQLVTEIGGELTLENAPNSGAQVRVALLRGDHEGEGPCPSGS